MSKKFQVYEEFVKPQRKVHTAFIHCSANSNPKWGVEECYHLHAVTNGWGDIGYHVFVERDGTGYLGRDWEKVPYAQAPFNTGSIAICLDGGQYGKDDFTDEQIAFVQRIMHDIDRAYDGKLKWKGHREVKPGRACPAFDYHTRLHISKTGNYLGGVATKKKLREAGSETIKAADRNDDVATGCAVLAAAGGGNAVVNGPPEPSALEKATSLAADATAWKQTMNTGAELLSWASVNWWLVLAAFAAVLIYKNRKLIRARLNDETKIGRLFQWDGSPQSA